MSKSIHRYNLFGHQTQSKFKFTFISSHEIKHDDFALLEFRSFRDMMEIGIGDNYAYPDRCNHEGQKDEYCTLREGIFTGVIGLNTGNNELSIVR